MVSKEQMSCWAGQLQGDGSRVAEVEYEPVVDGAWIGSGAEEGLRCCCRLGPLETTELRFCKEERI